MKYLFYLFVYVNICSDIVAVGRVICTVLFHSATISIG